MEFPPHPTLTSRRYQGLPALLKFDEEDLKPTSPLRYIIQARSMEVKSILYRPFLYCRIHHPATSGQHHQIEEFAQKALKICVQWIKFVPDLQWWHHGVWFMQRIVLTSALCLCAAKRSGLEVEEWEELAEEAMVNLGAWTNRAKDLERGRQVLENLI